MDRLSLERPEFHDTVLSFPELTVTCCPPTKITELRGGEAFREHHAWSLLPATHGKNSEHDPWRAIWLRPDGWLLKEPLGSTAVCAEFGEAAAAGLCRLTDLSHSLVCVSLEGPRAMELLAAGTTLNLSPRVFEVGSCTRTRCADFTVIVERRAAAVDVYVDASLAAAFWAWIADAGSSWLS